MSKTLTDNPMDFRGERNEVEVFHARNDGELSAKPYLDNFGPDCGLCSSHMLRRTDYSRFSAFYYCLNEDCQQWRVLVAL